MDFLFLHPKFNFLDCYCNFCILVGPEMEKKILSTEQTSYVIKDLKARTTYGVRVQSIAGDGRRSEYSEMKYVGVIDYSSTYAPLPLLTNGLSKFTIGDTG